MREGYRSVEGVREEVAGLERVGSSKGSSWRRGVEKSACMNGYLLLILHMPTRGDFVFN